MKNNINEIKEKAIREADSFFNKQSLSEMYIFLFKKINEINNPIDAEIYCGAFIETIEKKCNDLMNYANNFSKTVFQNNNKQKTV